MLINQATSIILFTTLSKPESYQGSYANSFHIALLDALFV